MDREEEEDTEYLQRRENNQSITQPPSADFITLNGHLRWGVIDLLSNSFPVGCKDGLTSGV